MATAEQIAALYRQHFPAFLRFAYNELHPGQPLVDSWHIDVVADHLERVAKGEITRLIINLPPRSLKSLSASIALPVWMLGRNPKLKIMSVAGSDALARDFDKATRELIRARRCRALFPHLDADSGRGDLHLAHGGQRISGVVGRTLVGRGADLIVVDDPIAPAHANDPARRNAVKKWFDAEVIPRLNDKARGAVVVVMQRLHQEDLCGHLLGGEQPWVHLKLPAVATRDETWRLPGGRTQARRKGEPLAPRIDNLVQLYERMLDIGAYNFGAQYQQAPFEHMNDEGMRGGGFAGPDDEWGFPTMCFGKVAETAIMAHEVFGVGEHHPARPARDMTFDEFERYSRWCEDYQRRLHDDPAAEFGPPEGETWPPDPNTPPPAPWIPPDEDEVIE